MNNFEQGERICKWNDQNENQFYSFIRCYTPPSPFRSPTTHPTSLNQQNCNSFIMTNQRSQRQPASSMMTAPYLFSYALEGWAVSQMINYLILQQLSLMDKDYYHSRLDKAKEMLMASRREQSPHGESAQKKKKKHKDDRRSHSRSRSEKKRRSRDRSDDRKHKKEHKHHREDKDKPRREEERHRERTERDRPDRERGDRSERDRDRDYDRRDKDRTSNRDREYRRRDDRGSDQKDPYFEQRREIQKMRKVDTAKAEQMEAELEKRMILDRKEKEIEEAREKFKQAQKQMQQAKREDHTILVYCLPLKAKERDIWNFFSKTNCGKIRDIRIIRDARSGRSKGVAYVEFYTAEAVQRALTMSDQPFELKGRQFMGLRVQHSQAEKNRAAAAAKQMRVIKPADPIEQQQETIRRQTKVFVGGLVDKLSEMQETELKELFQPFGEIEYVDIHRDPQTGMCKGFAFIQYQDTEKARLAVKEMNGLEIRNQKISVQLINVAQKGEVSAHEDYLYSAGSKQSLMNKLSASTGAPSYSNLQRPPISTVTTPYLIMTNMFKMEGTTPAFFDELKKEVQAQCDQFGVVERIFIERNNQGNIWIKYSDTASALKAQESLNGKFFDNVKVFCYFVTENTYQTRVGI